MTEKMNGGEREDEIDIPVKFGGSRLHIVICTPDFKVKLRSDTGEEIPIPPEIQDKIERVRKLYAELSKKMDDDLGDPFSETPESVEPWKD